MHTLDGCSEKILRHCDLCKEESARLLPENVLVKTPFLNRCMISLLLNRPENSFLDFTSRGHTRPGAEILLVKNPILSAES